MAQEYRTDDPILHTLGLTLILPEGGPLESIGSLHFSAPSTRRVQEGSEFRGVV